LFWIKALIWIKAANPSLGSKFCIRLQFVLRGWNSMMGVFEDRERGYEAKWAHDEETFFQIMTKRDAGLGQWAAETMQLSPGEADDYVKAVISASLTGKGKEPVFEKIRADFNAKNVACPDSIIRRKMKDLFDQATEAVLGKK
jgi:hypothetical protein